MALRPGGRTRSPAKSCLQGRVRSFQCRPKLAIEFHLILNPRGPFRAVAAGAGHRLVLRWAAAVEVPLRVHRWAAAVEVPLRAHRWAAAVVVPLRAHRWAAAVVVPLRALRWAAAVAAPLHALRLAAVGVEPLRAACPRDLSFPV
jgi:hypothetical protein